MRNGFYGASPRVSASLLHEIRMIATQIFGGRVDNYYSMRAAEAQAKAQAGPKFFCAVCLHTSKGKPAVTIISGNAVCEDHIKVFKTEDFLARVDRATR